METDSVAQIGTTSKVDAELRDVEAHVVAEEESRDEGESNKKRHAMKTQSSSSVGKWRAIAIFMIVASIIVVIVVPPSVIVPEKKKKTSNSSAASNKFYSSPITVAEIDSAQKAWGEALVKIFDTYSNQGIEAAKAAAQQVLDAAYGFNVGQAVSFKPTLAFGAKTFRFTNEGALIYFVGHNPKYPNDHGFALKNWTDVVSIRTGVLVDASGRFALSMGNVYFKNTKNEVTKVDKTWGYYKDNEGVLRIILHHSSLPYVPNATAGGLNIFPPAQPNAPKEVVGLLPNTYNPIPISLAEIEDAQNAWGDALLRISSTYKNQGIAAAKTLAQQVLDEEYAYKLGVGVLFKPTLASGDEEFRTINEGALSHFVGITTLLMMIMGLP